MSTAPHRATGLDQRAIGSLEPQVHRREDHGPYYLITVGEPIHRVQQRDGVPHLYPMKVETVKTWANWTLQGYSGPNVLMSAQNSSGERVDANPIFASDIVQDVLTVNPQYASMGTISLQAFAKRDSEDLDIEGFNALIMPEPIWFDFEEVPTDQIRRYRAEYPDLADAIRKEGALMRRERLLREAMARIDADTRNPNRSLYLAACQEIISALVTYRTFGLVQLGAADTAIRDRDKSGKSVYDRADLRRQWLFARKGIDAPLVELVNQQPANITVTMPTAAQTPTVQCENCGAVANLLANGNPPTLCWQCKKRFPQPQMEEATI